VFAESCFLYGLFERCYDDGFVEGVVRGVLGDDWASRGVRVFGSGVFAGELWAGLLEGYGDRDVAGFVSGAAVDAILDLSRGVPRLCLVFDVGGGFRYRFSLSLDCGFLGLGREGLLRYLSRVPGPLVNSVRDLVRAVHAAKSISPVLASGGFVEREVDGVAAYAADNALVVVDEKGNVTVYTTGLTEEYIEMCDDVLCTYGHVDSDGLYTTTIIPWSRDRELLLDAVRQELWFILHDQTKQTTRHGERPRD